MIEFKKAGFHDLETLARTRRKVWDTTYRGIYPDEKIDHYKSHWYMIRDRKRMMDPNQDYYLVMDGEECVGYFYYGTPHVKFKDYSFCLNALYLLPAYQGQGIGRRIFDHIRQVCRERGISKFFNGCNVHNLPAQGFYYKMGGVVEVIDDGHENKAEDQMYFEYQLEGETI
jgi:GNAT superfamily N-acetyltransferase